jgi:pantoate--beta-alanine ligase
MEILTSIAAARDVSRKLHREGKRIGFVPTMGALHEGHLSLMRAAKAHTDVVVVSIFVNPTQFGPNEDLSRYPRPFERDCSLLEREGVEVLFAPAALEMYPSGAVTYVDVEGMSECLCGKSRPGHFRGVTTVVSKLFHIIEPDAAFFGQKDAAQLAIIRRMVRDLNIPVEIIGCPIVREADGLAMSSRNSYLSENQRKDALSLNRALMRVQSEFEHGERMSSHLIESGKQVIAAVPSVRLDYLEIVDPFTLEAVEDLSTPSLVAVAAFVGSTRLIDNLVLGA